MVHELTQKAHANSTVEDRKRNIFNKNQRPVFTWQFRFRMTKKLGNAAAWR